ncbi:hypothetical protein NKH89_34570 [Mesorhizobium sp. M0923]|uniref:hypothetical protein n=1 Tax=Mesorhizobium sp. M0923 TaxID=2957028 RepID=UPI0033394B96
MEKIRLFEAFIPGKRHPDKLVQLKFFRRGPVAYQDERTTAFPVRTVVAEQIQSMQTQIE